MALEEATGGWRGPTAARSGSGGSGAQHATYLNLIRQGLAGGRRFVEREFYVTVECEGQLAAINAWRVPPHTEQSAPRSHVAEGERIGVPSSHDGEGSSGVQKRPHRVTATKRKAEGEMRASPRDSHDLGGEPHKPVSPP